MKFKLFSMVIILGVIVVMPLIYMGKLDPMAFIHDGFTFDFASGSLTSKRPEGITSVVTDEKVQVYKWRNKNGVMQFSSEPPPAAAGAEQIELNPNSNVIQAVRIPQKSVNEAPKAVATTQMPNPYAVKGMKKVMADAKNVEQVLQKRHEDQMKMLDDL